MKLIVCLDDRMGMMFNHRRQSRDRLLIDDLEKLVGDRKVYMMPYSEGLFLKNNVRYILTDTPFTDADREDYCFIETVDPTSYMRSVTEIVIYHWNRHYPADLYFTFDMKGFTLTQTAEFAGSSHEKITREVWKR